mgnify:CR=1 FL=1
MTLTSTTAPPLPALSLAGSAKFTRIFSRLLLVGFIAFVIGILFLPWRQFVSGAGRVIAFNPLDRRINIEAQVSGRVKHLHVVEGQKVKKGELIIEIQDNDPDLLNNLKAQREAIESRRDFAHGRVESLTAQITQQELAKAQAIDGAEQRVAAAKIAAERGATLVPSFDDPWVVEGQGSALRARQRPITTGELVGAADTAEGQAGQAARPDRYEVRSGLKAGERVVISGIQKLHDGSPVTLEPEAGAADKADGGSR